MLSFLIDSECGWISSTIQIRESSGLCSLGGLSLTLPQSYHSLWNERSMVPPRKCAPYLDHTVSSWHPGSRCPKSPESFSKAHMGLSFGSPFSGCPLVYLYPSFESWTEELFVEDEEIECEGWSAPVCFQGPLRCWSESEMEEGL